MLIKSVKSSRQLTLISEFDNNSLIEWKSQEIKRFFDQGLYHGVGDVCHSIRRPFLDEKSGNFVWLRQNTVAKFGNEFIERSTAVKALLQKVIYRILKNGYNTDSSCFCEEKTPESQNWFRFWRFGLVLTRHLGDKYSKKCVTEIKKITYFSGCLGYN